MDGDQTTASKLLSFVLRHRPEAIGLILDSEGWASIAELIRLANEHGHKLSRDLIEAVVRTSDKQRFAISADRQRIRANQGHSIAVALGLEALKPPELLFHGTAERFLSSIQSEGLSRRSRNYVHLSADAETATRVGQRHGTPVVLVVAATRMWNSGFQFFQSENGVWLTNHVPVKYIQFASR
ncbi:MAG TPA: RNA 2'-phosphotransferase [Polyangiaceae bacterium]